MKTMKITKARFFLQFDVLRVYPIQTGGVETITMPCWFLQCKEIKL